MLDTSQMGDLDAAARELHDKKTILDIAVDIQATLRLLVEKEIISKNEINRTRNEVRKSPKYANGYTYIRQTLNEIDKYKADPREHLKEMFKRKIEQ